MIAKIIKIYPSFYIKGKELKRQHTYKKKCIKCSRIFAWAHTFIKTLFPGAQQHFQYYIITLMHVVVGGVNS